MIGVVPPCDADAVTEFFELFKTPWAHYEPEQEYDAIIAPHSAGALEARGAVQVRYLSQPSIAKESPGAIYDAGGIELPLYGAVKHPIVHRRDVGGETHIELNFDPFAETRRVLTHGQRSELAEFPTVDLLIEVLRRQLVASGVGLLEVPPSSSEDSAMACLTHDVDFFNLRDHRFDHTFFGFLYRASVGSWVDALRGREDWQHVLVNLRTLAQLPAVMSGSLPDPWDRFREYGEIERTYGSTFFVVPHSGVPGRAVDSRRPARRSVKYELSSMSDRLEELARSGFEVALHGIDAWLDPRSAASEREAVEEITGRGVHGMRSHWLLYDEQSPSHLEEAGIEYDATRGFNDAIGFQAGTAQVFKPLNAARLLELPLIVQDTALLRRSRRNLGEDHSLVRLQRLWKTVERMGGVFTSLWHLRSLAPERNWGGVYLRMLEMLQSGNAAFANAQDTVGWFRARRQVAFESAGGSGGFMTVRGDRAQDMWVQVTTGRGVTMKARLSGTMNLARSRGDGWRVLR